MRLTRDKFDGKTLTAITVAAHECGHAYPARAAEPLFMLRTRLAGTFGGPSGIGSFLLFAPPFSVLLTKRTGRGDSSISAARF